MVLLEAVTDEFAGSLDELYDDEGELSTLIESVRMTRALGAAEAFDDWNGGEFFPGVEVESDAEISGYIKETISTWFHPVGTCGIGSVVDGDGRVLGFENLVVADASIMPTIPRANTNVSVAAVAERIADRMRAG